MKLFIKQKIRKNFIKEKFFVSLILLSIFVSFSFSDLRALDPLNSNLSYYPSEVPFVLNVVKIFFPEKYEVWKLGTGNHWKVLPTQGRAWMLILREWEGFPSGSLQSLVKDLFPDYKDLVLPEFRGLKMIGGERKEIVAGNPLTIRYFLLERKGKVVSIYLCFESENKTVSVFFQDPRHFLQPLFSDSF
ncbi:acyltransferase [Leptospira alexanderi]|uniref:acyltransferase n=1 Tax=Leptospira alexanderi TaxID=100053 RepID=UPI000990B6E5|nr:acyltransferase [Leptospira alexanderi]